MKLTTSGLDALKPRRRPYRVSDGAGLDIEVLPGGEKVWLYRFRLAGALQGCPIGRYPFINLDQARLREKKLRAMIGKGHFPQI